MGLDVALGAGVRVVPPRAAEVTPSIDEREPLETALSKSRRQGNA
ncbi:hypothetical protein ADIMK_4108 [Marinobacterium lacunae]|uniref:Uncharacterized protein n=1 Tax=Marinobacterium lacunae TaxID=1232683 RepID=A0A081FTA0_9GAMM|nr:hypothetical protein ADIMK_4108 [Marinobacterium lacunae]